MRFRSIAILLAMLAAALLPCDRVVAQREKSRITTRPMRSAAQSTRQPKSSDDSKTDGQVRRTAAEGPAENGLTPVDDGQRRGVTRVTRGAGALPNEHGQIWCEYDITPFTRRAKELPRPEQTIVDWILRETGYEVWHSEPLGVLSTTPSVLRVYHTPDMQAVVEQIVDRFVNPAERHHAFGLRLISLSNPNWRSRSPAKLNPVEVQSPGVQAWLMAKEEAALLMAELRKRTDFREYGSPQLLAPNGQPTVVSALRSRTFTQHLLPGLPGIATYEPRLGEIEEGIAVEFAPLISVDGNTIDALVKCNIDQVERILPVAIESSTPMLARERTKVEVPQRVQLRVKEAFRWSVNEVLVVSLGLVPSPSPGSDNLLEKAIPFPSAGDRAEVLLMVESRGRIAPPEAEGKATRRQGAYHGRY